MADLITVKTEGLKELYARMRGLGLVVTTRYARAATAAGANVIKKRAIRNVISSPSVDQGDLRDNIITKRIPPSQTRLTSAHIVTVRGKGRKATKKTGAKRGAPHAHFVEYGTVNMPAEPFLRPAYDQGKGEAIDAMIKLLKRRLERAGA